MISKGISGFNNQSQTLIYRFVRIQGWLKKFNVLQIMLGSYLTKINYLVLQTTEFGYGDKQQQVNNKGKCCTEFVIAWGSSNYLP